MKASNLEEEREKIERALSKRLEAHDKSRSAAQEKLEEICKELETNVTELENRVGSELEEKSAAESNRLQSALDDLQSNGDAPKATLFLVQSYDVVTRNAKEESIPNFDVSSLYELKTEKKNYSEKFNDAEECEEIEEMLSECIEAHDESRRAAQDRLHELCEGLRSQVAELRSRVNKGLEEKFTAEDRRLQEALSGLRTADDSDDVKKVFQRAKTELLVMQSYDVIAERGAKMKGGRLNFDVSTLYELKTATVFVPEVLGMLKPTGVRAFRNGKRDGLSSVHVP